MRIFALLFFVLTMPVVVLIATVLYGGLSTTILKTELSKSGIYDKTLSVLREPSSGDENYQAQQEDQVMSALAVFITPGYLQEKTEKVIDDSSDWITGKTTTPPVLSFKEIKDRIDSQNPGLLTNIQEMSQSIQKEANAEGGKDTSNVQNKTMEKDMLSDFVKNDFSLPLQKNLQGVKDFYDNLKLAFPALIGFLIVYLALLLGVNNSWRKRTRWIGITLLIAAGWGYLLAIVFNVLVQTIIGTILQEKDQLIQLVVPIIQRLVTPFALLNLSYQTTVSIVCLIVGIISLALSFIMKEQAPLVAVPIKRVQSKKTLRHTQGKRK